MLILNTGKAETNVFIFLKILKENKMDAYIVAGFRSAVGKAKKGGFKNYRSDDLAVDVVKHLMSTVPDTSKSGLGQQKRVFKTFIVRVIDSFDPINMTSPSDPGCLPMQRALFSG